MNLFLTKKAAFESGVEGEVCIGYPKIHSVCMLKDGVLRYLWTRTLWG